MNNYKKQLKEYNKECYFCSFNIQIHKHHIIRKCDLGNNKEDNLIGLCPNHHTMLHDNYILQFTKGVYLMRKKQDKDNLDKDFILYPTQKQFNFRRKLPFEQLDKAINENKLKIREIV